MNEIYKTQNNNYQLIHCWMYFGGVNKTTSIVIHNEVRTFQCTCIMYILHKQQQSQFAHSNKKCKCNFTSDRLWSRVGKCACVCTADRCLFEVLHWIFLHNFYTTFYTSIQSIAFFLFIRISIFFINWLIIVYTIWWWWLIDYIWSLLLLRWMT